jgi:hypothetical protein
MQSADMHLAHGKSIVIADMDRVIRVNIRVRKYLWSEFVHDVVYVTVATLVISNALSKRFLHVSLRQIQQGIVYVPNHLINVVFYGVIGMIGVVAMASLFWIPVVLFLVVIGKIQ